MIDKLTQIDLDLLNQWGACEESLEYRKVGQPLSEIPEKHRGNTTRCCLGDSEIRIETFLTPSIENSSTSPFR